MHAPTAAVPCGSSTVDQSMGIGMVRRLDYRRICRGNRSLATATDINGNFGVTERDVMDSGPAYAALHVIEAEVRKIYELLADGVTNGVTIDVDELERGVSSWIVHLQSGRVQVRLPESMPYWERKKVLRAIEQTEFSGVA